MENQRNTNLIEALKEYNKSLSEQISRIKAFLEEIDKQLSHQRKIDKEINQQRISTPFSREYLAGKAHNNVN